MAAIRKITIPVGATLPNGKPLTDTMKTIINNRKTFNGSVMASVPTVETLEDLYSAALPTPATTIDAFINVLQRKAEVNTAEANRYLTSVGERTVAMPTGSAFNNCNGKWTEDGYAVFAWNSLAKMNRNSRKNSGGKPYTVYIYVKLPNRASAEKDWTQLLDNGITSVLSTYPTAQGNKVPASSCNAGRRFELISSNPDSVILKFDNTVADQLWQSAGITSFGLYTDISCINAGIINDLDSLFDLFKGKVLPSKNLQCFLSIKRSTRPDRRYQWVQEGDHVKTILQWIYVYSTTNSNMDSGLRYEDLNGKFFAVSLSEVSDTDKEAMNTGLVGSVVSPLLSPVWAVDKVFECRSFDRIDPQINEMLIFK